MGIDSLNGLTAPALNLTSTNGTVVVTTVAPNNVNLAVGSIGYTPLNPEIWQGGAPSTVNEAINRLSMILYGRTAVSGLLPQTGVNSRVLVTANGIGSSDALVMKQSFDGNPQWVARITGSGVEEGRGVATDASGSVYVTGLFTIPSVTIFNADGTIFTTLANAGIRDAFIVKYNTNGAVQWATRIGGSAGEAGLGIAVSAIGNVYVTGSYASNPVTIFNADGTTFTTLANAGQEDTYIVKYNTSGFGAWATRISTNTSDEGRGIALDASENVHVVGGYSNSPLTIFNSNGTTFGTLSNGGQRDTFIVKYNTNGFGAWATRISSASFDNGNGVALDSFGNVIVVGTYFGSTATIFNSNGTVFTTLTNLGQEDTCVVKFSSDGFGAWATRISGTNGNDSGRGVAVSDDNSIYITGDYSGGATIFNSNGTTFSTLIGEGDAFLVRYDFNGFVSWATRIGGLQLDRGLGVAANSAGVYVTGECSVSAARTELIGFYNANGTLFTTAQTGFFTARYDALGNARWVTNAGGSGVAVDSGFNVYSIGTRGGVEYIRSPGL